MAIIKFIKGTVAQYTQNKTTYDANGSIYFATDQPIIFANGVAYKGVDQDIIESVIDGVKDVSFNSGTKKLTISYFKEGTQDKTIDLKEAMVEYSGSNAITVTGDADSGKTIALKIKEGDKVLSQDTNGLASTLSLKYLKAEENTADGTYKGKPVVQLLGIGNAVVAEFDATDFVIDAFLDKVELDGSELTFTWNTTSNKEATTIDLADYIKAYTAGAGLALTNQAFSIKLKSEGEKYLELTTGGELATKGIDASISAAVAIEEARAEGVEGELDERITALEGAVGDDSVEDQIQEAIEALDAGPFGGTGKVITTVSETDGIINATAIDLTAANVAITAITDISSLNVQGALSELKGMLDWHEA